MKNYLLIIFIIAPILAFSQSIGIHPASDIGIDTSVINGEFVDVNGGMLLYGTFQYYKAGETPWSNSENANPAGAMSNNITTSAVIKDLLGGTKYYYRFRAATDFNNLNHIYSPIDSFTTLLPIVPEVTTGVDFTNISNQYADNADNEVVNENGAPVTERGIAYSNTNSTPLITDNCKKNGSGSGTYQGFLNGLDEATKYYARAYAKNSAGTGYGSTIRTFTTLPTTRAAINSMVSNATNELTIDFTASSGSQTMILMREGTQIIDYPVNATTYTGNAAFGSGTDLGNNTYVIYAGSGAKGSVTVTNLDGTKDYYIDIVDAAESGSDIVYFFDNDQMNSADDSNLPVELVYFNGEIDGNDNILSWATASELNNHYFKLEKSYDLTNFTVVDEVFGHGNSLQLNEYSISDNDENNLVYYRLSQYDFDGTETVFDVIAIQKTQASEINIEKVLLADNMLSVSVKTTELNSQLEIFNLNGKLIHSEEIYQNGLNTLNINMGELSKGIYLMKLSNEKEISVMKFYY